VDRNRLSVCSDSLFKELAFSSCKPYNASSSLDDCQYFYFKNRLKKYAGTVKETEECFV
jgi:hypothetical protein